MRSSEFWELVDGEFGIRGRLVVREHVLRTLGGLTAQQALADGEDARRVWFALCDDFDIPEQRRWPGEPRPR